VRRILARTGLFIVPAVALWALLPLVASDRLGFGSGGYGVLLAALGVGAIAGAVLLPRVRARFTSNTMLALSSLVYGAVLLVVGLVDQPVVVVAVLVPAGVAWIATLSTVNATLQLFLPGWVRARGLSIYQIVVFGGQGVASVLWGLLAEHAGLGWAFVGAAVLMVAGAAGARLLPLRETAHLDRSSVVYWPEPHLAIEPEPDGGPVVVSVAYTVAPEREQRFLAAMADVGRSRRRTGAIRWGIFREGETPGRFVEVYLVASWEEHLRQHEGRLTATDQAFEETAQALAEGPGEVSHLLPAAYVTADPNER
jgi:MFS family permease